MGMLGFFSSMSFCFEKRIISIFSESGLNNVCIESYLNLILHKVSVLLFEYLR